MAKQTNREKWRELNLQINGQLKAAGVIDHRGKIVNPLDTFPASEWKTWIMELMQIRDRLTETI